MPSQENPKIGESYIWIISSLLFIFTISGAIFLLLYVSQPISPSTSWYAVTGVFLVFLPWFFWLLTYLYRLISRTYGFRMICFGSFGSDYPNDDNKKAPAARSDPVSNNVVPAARSNMVSKNVGSSDGVAGDGNRELTSVTSPKRVHFGEVVIMGQDDGAKSGVGNDDQVGVSVGVLSKSMSSSSLLSRHGK